MLPREIPAAELPSTPRLNAIMDRAMAKVKALLYELEMDRGKKHEGKKERKKERTKDSSNDARKGGEERGMKRRERKEDKNKNRKRLSRARASAASKTRSHILLLSARRDATRREAVTQFPPLCNPSERRTSA